MLGYIDRSRVTVLAVVAASALALGGTALAAPGATPTDRKVTALQVQVRSLQKQVKTLRVQVTLANREIQANWISDACLTASAADVFQGTWSVIDTMAQALQTKTYFGPQQPVNDFGACDTLIPPVARDKKIPPTVSPFQSLVNWIHG